ncbi:MAG: hypothetical protein Q9220_003882 [cf. Caloplaca sp. 1 TL-2023]
MFIAEVRAGKREGSVVSVASIDTIARHNREVWNALRRELEDIGISPSIISEKRQHIIAWFQHAVATGQLEEDMPSDDTPSLHTSYNISDVGEIDNEAPLWEIEDPSGEESAFENPVSRDVFTSPQLDSLGKAIGKASFSDFSRTPEGGPSKRPSRGRKRSQKLVASLLSMVQGQRKKPGAAKKNIEGFMRAVKAENVEGVTHYLKLGVNINVKIYKDGDEDALFAAVGDNHVQTARFLLDNGANVESRSSTMVLSKHPDDVYASLRIPRMTSLQLAAWKGEAETVQLLLDYGADLQFRSRCFVLKGNEWLYDQQDALYLAVGSCTPDTVKVLLEHHASVEITYAEGTALCRAVRLCCAISKVEWGRNHPRVLIAMMLLEKGASTEATSYGQTPLNFTLTMDSSTRLETLGMLLEAGANTEARYRGHTPLFQVMMLAREHTEYHELADLLLRHGANFHAKVASSKLWTSAEGDDEITILEWAQANGEASKYKVMRDAIASSESAQMSAS